MMDILFSLLLALPFVLPLTLWPCPPDCCEPAGCTHCDGTLPTYFEVTFGSIGNQTQTCTNWNGKTFRLCAAGECVWQCEDDSGDPIKLTVYLDGTDYKIKVEAGLTANTDHTDHVWEKNYGTSKPTCGTLSGEALTHISDNNTNCVSTGSTCAITAVTEPCTPWCGEPCECGNTCIDEIVLDQQFQVNFSGMVDGTCSKCNELNAAHTFEMGRDNTRTGGGAQMGSNCVGWIEFPDYDASCAASFFSRIELEFSPASDPGYIVVRIFVDIFFGADYIAKWRLLPDPCSLVCGEFTNVNIPFHSQSGTICNAAGATVTITAL
jgi:hypothetical protein